MVVLMGNQTLFRTMKKCTLSTVVATLMIINAALCQDNNTSASVLSKQKHKPSVYYGLGIGSGQGWVERNTFNTLFKQQEEEWNVDTERSFRFALNVGVGIVLNPKWQVGLDLSASRQYVDKKEWGKDQDMSYRINNYLLCARYFPSQTGLSFKAGIGLPGYQGRVLREVIRETYSGYAVLAGVGYDLRMDKTMKIGFHLDYSHQRYPGQAGPDYTNMINAHVAFYWWRNKTRKA
jgi:opacity protein-like surface antigen